MRMRRLALKGVYVVLLICLLYLVLLTAWMLLPGPFVDFPCSVHLDEETGCVLLGYPSEEPTTLEVYLSSYSYHTYGGGCYEKSSANGMLKVRTEGFNLLFERVGEENIRVNGRILERGETYSAKKVLTIDPWGVDTITFTNLGSPNICDTPECRYAFLKKSREKESAEGAAALCNSTSGRTIVSGETNSHFSLVKGMSLWAIVIVCLFLVHRSLRRSKPAQDTSEKRREAHPFAHFTLRLNAAKVIIWAIFFSVPLLNELRFIIPNFDPTFFAIEKVILPIELVVSFILLVPEMLLYGIFSGVQPWWLGMIAIPLLFEGVLIYVLACFLYSLYRMLKNL